MCTHIVRDVYICWKKESQKQKLTKQKIVFFHEIFIFYLLPKYSCYFMDGKLVYYFIGCCRCRCRCCAITVTVVLAVVAVFVVAVVLVGLVIQEVSAYVLLHIIFLFGCSFPPQSWPTVWKFERITMPMS